MELNYCRRCGTRLSMTEQPYRYECSRGHVIYANASPTVGIFFIEPDGTVLLSRRGIEPYKGRLDCFGGFLDGKETLDDALARELREELQLEPGDYEPPRFLTSMAADYPYADETTPIISILFWTRLNGRRDPVASDDVAEIVRVHISDLVPDDMSADDTTRGIFVLKDLYERNMLN